MTDEHSNTRETPTTDERVNHPPHYTAHPSGVECIEITEHYGFCIGNAIKYLWRAGLKGDAIEDLKKSVWYIQREIMRREHEGLEKENLQARTRESTAL